MKIGSQEGNNITQEKLHHPNLVDPVHVIFPEDHIVAVTLGLLNFIFNI